VVGEDGRTIELAEQYLNLIKRHSKKPKDLELVLVAAYQSDRKLSVSAFVDGPPDIQTLRMGQALTSILAGMMNENPWLAEMLETHAAAIETSLEAGKSHTETIHLGPTGSVSKTSQSPSPESETQSDKSDQTHH